MATRYVIRTVDGLTITHIFDFVRMLPQFRA